jgi:hypothetical protein
VPTGLALAPGKVFVIGSNYSGLQPAALAPAGTEARAASRSRHRLPSSPWQAVDNEPSGLGEPGDLS